MQALATMTNINSWCQKVLDLLDLTFAELFWIIQGTLGNLDSQLIITITNDSSYTLMVILIILTFSSNKEGKLVDFMEYSRYF